MSDLEFQNQEIPLSNEHEENPTHENNKRHRISGRKLIIILPILALLYFGFRWIERTVWDKRLSSETTVTEFRNSRHQPTFKISVSTAAENSVSFSSPAVFRQGGFFQITSNDLPQGDHWLHYSVSREGWSVQDSVFIQNPYSPITVSIGYERDSSNRVNAFSFTTEPGARLCIGSLDTVLTEGFYVQSLSPDSIMQAHHPDLTPTILLTYPAVLENSSGNSVRDTVRVAYSFPRVSMSVSDPWNCYISRTGSGYTIRGNTTSRATVKFYAGPDIYYRSLGQVRANQSGDFSKWVSVPEFGDNIFTMVASVDGMTSDTTRITIFRQMTDAERRTAYQNQCERVTAEYLADHHASLVGSKVRVWGRTLEWLGQSQLHCYAGNGHFIANLIGFERVPALEGLSFTVWGEVTSRSQDFYTSGGDYVHAPVIDAVYTTTSY